MMALEAFSFPQKISVLGIPGMNIVRFYSKLQFLAVLIHFWIHLSINSLNSLYRHLSQGCLIVRSEQIKASRWRNKDSKWIDWLKQQQYVCVSVSLQSWLAGWFAEVLRRWCSFWLDGLFFKKRHLVPPPLRVLKLVIPPLPANPMLGRSVFLTARQEDKSSTCLTFSQSSYSAFYSHCPTVETEEQWQNRETEGRLGVKRNNSVVLCTGEKVYR